ncbi:unnamed protein product [Rhizophagus irregularis]|nr:unnamed protein product [Rhizophagus irregularis]
MNDKKSRKTFLSGYIYGIDYKRFGISILMIKRTFHPGFLVMHDLKNFYIKERDTADQDDGEGREGLSCYNYRHF